MSDTIVEVRGLKKMFRDFWFRPVADALKGIDLTIARGDVFGLLGPNGSGKSTTVKLILGLLSPDAGTVKVFGASPRSREVRSRLGYLPELSCLHPYLTARETLHYYAGLSGLSRAETRRRSNELLEQVGLGAVAERAVGGFSKGMARRVAFASALISRPELLILDEPTSGLDPIATREVKELIRSLAQSGVTILMTSHLLADSEDVCSNIAILSKGQVAASGRVDELLTRTSDARFTVAALPEDEARRFADDAAKRLGRDVKFDHPRVPLEEFFAETVEAFEK